MQILSVVLFSLCVVQSWAALSGCDEKITSKIEALWKVNGMPRNVLGTLARKGKGTLLYSTEVVPLKELPIDSPKCINGEFTLTTSKFSVVPKTGTIDATKGSVQHAASEKDGVVYEDKGAVAKYIISNKYGVTSFYTCKPSAQVTGSPAAGLAVAINKYKTSKAFIDAAKDELTSLGLKLSTDYTKSCV